MQQKLSLTLVALLSLFWAALAQAEQRIALVIGNSAYSAVPTLDNPGADSRLMAQALEASGFHVTLLNDADQVTMNRAIAQFGRELRAAGDTTTGLFYYAGHAVQSFGNNYLLPSDISLTDAADLPLVGIEAQAVLRQMASASNRTNIVILDACRDNPFQRIASLDDNGLAEMKAPTGTFLSYSTEPSAVALDGMEGNSPFTAALARRIIEPGVPLEQMFKQVRVDVLRATNGRQVPWDTSSLTSDFVFTAAPQADPVEQGAEALWTSVKDTGDAVQILLFLRAYPESRRAPEARALLNRLIGGASADPVAAVEPADPVAAVEPATPPDVIAAVEPPASRAAPPLPDLSEREMIEIARTSGRIEDYQAYLAAYPTGVYGELAAFEVSILESKASEAAKTPAPAPEPAAEVAVVVPNPAPPEQAAVPVTFDTPLTDGGEAVVGKTLEQLIGGSPLFPPIEGLPEEVWKGKHCSNCHDWKRANLCDQAKTYLAANGSRALSKLHPYGGGLKSNLRRWAENDCR